VIYDCRRPYVQTMKRNFALSTILWRHRQFYSLCFCTLVGIIFIWNCKNLKRFCILLKRFANYIPVLFKIDNVTKFDRINVSFGDFSHRYQFCRYVSFSSVHIAVFQLKLCISDPDIYTCSNDNVTSMLQSEKKSVKCHIEFINQHWKNFRRVRLLAFGSKPNIHDEYFFIDFCSQLLSFIWGCDIYKFLYN